jgi:integrase
MNPINYPKVVSGKNGKVYLNISVRGKRMRLFNGSRFGLDLQPNSFPLPQRVNQAHILAAQVYTKLLAGDLPFLEVGERVVVSCRSFSSNLYLCCLLTYGCLLRPHREIRELTWGDFSEDLSYISLAGNRNKSGRNRVVPVPSYVRSVLKRKESHLNIFSGSITPYNPDYFKSLWSRFKKRSKILQPEQTLYSFRHTGAIEVYKRTGSIEKLKTVMGHSSIVVSLTYLRGLNVTELNEQDMPNLGPLC